jgi:hypothetical protein
MVFGCYTHWVGSGLAWWVGELHGWGGHTCLLVRAQVRSDGGPPSVPVTC